MTASSGRLVKRARPEIAPGSVADRIRSACPAGVGGTMPEIVAAALARAEDVKAEVQRLRAAGYIRTSGRRRSMRYFWRRTNRRRDQ
jgi:hypothetical protein